MKMKKIILLLISVIGLSISVQAADAKSDRLFQVALLQSLMRGEYDGVITVWELKHYGDTGIGTFQGVNGELIALNGKVYRAAWDGSVEIAPDDETVPFSNVTFFDDDIVVENVKCNSIDELKSIFDSIVNRHGKNQFYMVKLSGNFSKMLVRSELPQHEPYRPLAEALKTDQREFSYENINGTVVALYCPDYMEGLNSSGWHLHFVSDDETKGGHVLGLEVANATLAMDIISEFSMIVPNRASFNGKDLAADMKEEIREVEQDTVEMK